MKTHAHRQHIDVYLIPKRKTTKLHTDITVNKKTQDMGYP